ncbi:MAG: hypothetical protein AABZ64_00550 [Nitrospinota bacterium]
MKVASVEVFRVDMPMRGFFKNAFHNHDLQPCCLVRLDEEKLARYRARGAARV